MPTLIYTQHHGDGVYYEFEDDLDTLQTSMKMETSYPGTGLEWETGIGDAEGTKLNISLNPKFQDIKILLHLLKEWKILLITKQNQS